MEKLYSINELIEKYEKMRSELPHLAGLGELSETTVRYYQQKGLFRPTGSSGKEARYSEDTLWRIIFTRILQLRSAQVLHRKTTLPEIASILQGIDPETVARIATGKEDLSIGVLPEENLVDNLASSSLLDSRSYSLEPGRGWKDYSSHPDIELKIGRKLTSAQENQVRIVAKLLESILNG